MFQQTAATRLNRFVGRPMRTALAALYSLAACAPALAAAYSALPSAPQIRHDIAVFGAKEVLVDRIYGNERISSEFLARVESGQAQWLDVAVLLRPASDAGSSEELQGAISGALANRPRNVLHLLKAEPSLFSVQAICSAQFGFVEQPKKERMWRRRAVRAVSLVKESALSDVRADCMRRLGRTSRFVVEKSVSSYQRTCARC